ncbi:MAG: hypothetical protein ACYC5N_08225 [Endomicrobiales bacterium]
MTDDKDSLIDLDSIIKNLEHTHQRNRGVEAIPIAKIVGSLGRYQDFSEEFLPHRERVNARYESIKRAMLSGKILPPIKVYQVFDSYFVIDGHHRVTVAKNELKAEAIDAEVTEIHFALDLSVDKKYVYNTEKAKEFLITLEEDAFQNKTSLRNGILVHPLKVTDLTSFGKLYEEILDFRRNYNEGELAKKAIINASYLWYEKRFFPAVRIILEEGILSHFPRRTYTDLYLWIQQHKYYLSQQTGFDVGFDFTKDDFLRKFHRSKFLDLLPPVVRDIVRGIKKEIKKI